VASDAENQLDKTENEHRASAEDSKYCHWKRISDNVVLATTKGEIEGKYFPGRRRTAWIDDVRRWTGDDMNVARTNAMERRYDCW